MKRPLKKDWPITQKFGENPQIYKRWGLKGHNGIDWGCPNGTPVYSPIDGKVTEVANDPQGYGKYVKVENDRYGCLVAHLKRWDVAVGQSVNAGQTLLGLSNNTGYSTGPHLHFGIFTKPRNRKNGFNGYVDPLPILEGGEEEVANRRETIKEIYKAIYHREPTKAELDRWDLSQKATSVTVAELWSSLEIEKKLSTLTNQVSGLERSVNELQKSVNTKFESLATDVGNLRSEVETERKIASEMSSKTEKTLETMTDLIKSDSQQEGLLRSLGERISTLERGLRDVVKQVKEVSKGGFQGARKTKKPQVPFSFRSWFTSLLKQIARLKPR